MCGRYANFASTDDVVAAFGIELLTTLITPSWNIAPTQEVAVVVEDPGTTRRYDGPVRRELRAARWGLVPSWAKGPTDGPLLINARAETVTTKPAFRVAARQHRALVPACGYYEWLAPPGQPKTPYYLHPREDQPLALAGLWTWWRLPASSDATDRLPGQDKGTGDWLCSVAIITRAATDALGHIHDRMPVVVPPGLVEPWLDPELTERDQVEDLLAGMPNPELVPNQVSRAVGSVRNNFPELIAPIDRQVEVPK